MGLANQVDYNMEKILITGGNGLLGTKLIEKALAEFEIYSLSKDQEAQNKFLGDFKYYSVDITQAEEVEKVMQEIKPAVVIHTAAFTNVDGAESQKKLAWAVNVEGSRNIFTVAKEIGAKMVYISTDYIFDGQQGPYSEEAQANPLGYYAQTKWEAEKLLQKIDPQALICRTTILYGLAPHIRNNFVTWVIDSLEKGQEIKLVDDQIGNPTLADNLAEMILALIKKKAQGVFNTAGDDLASRYDFALKIAETFNLNKDLIKRLKTSELKQPAPRPLNGGFILNKLKNTIKVKPWSIDEQLNYFYNQYTYFTQSKV